MLSDWTLFWVLTLPGLAVLVVVAMILYRIEREDQADEAPETRRRALTGTQVRILALVFAALVILTSIIYEFVAREKTERAIREKTAGEATGARQPG